MLDRDVVIVSLRAAAGSEQTERVAVKQESRFVQVNVTLQSINTAGLQGCRAAPVTGGDN